MVLYDPWAWRDPTILAGGYDAVTPDRGPSPPSSPPSSGDDEGGPGTQIDLAGYSVTATDGDIGSVEALDAAAGHLIIDTGPWIFGRTVLLPAGTVERVDHRERKVYIDRTREQVKDAPAYDPSAADSRARVGDYYTGLDR
jgi:hypothetical protein